MWFMGGSDDFHGSIESGGRNNKLRPLMPRQPINPIMQTHSNILPWARIGHHEYGFKREGPHAHTVALVSTRWNPTPEQLQGLEELYRRGTRTPSAEQIQHIASRLRRFGKIEGKNVFYWFQNHKARERQKKRRQLHQPGPPTPGLSKRPYLDHNKLATPTIPPQEEEEESASMHGSVIAERKKDVWTQSELQDDIEIITSWKLDVSPSTNINMYTSIPTPKPTNYVVGDPGMKTLQLFPIRTVEDRICNHEDGSSRVCLGNQSGLNNNQFIEFLPTKKYI